MSWANELLSVYEKNCNHEKMLPICHSTFNAQIEITIDEYGNFVRAEKILKKDAKTVIPVTEKSVGRTGNNAPHPLADKIMYIAGDYPDYVDDNTEYFAAYTEQLQKWVDSEYTHKSAQTILKYIQKKSVMKDISSCGVFQFDESGQLMKNVEIENGIIQEDSFVRFRITHEDDDEEECTWKDPELINSFIEYTLSLDKDKERGLCNITGEVVAIANTHPSKIRNAGDKCKLISANDKQNFYFRGRFETKEQALSVGYLCSQKIHNTLRWLIEQQGVRIGTTTVIVWENKMKELPNIIGGFDFSKDAEPVSTLPIYRYLLKESILGYKNRLDKDSKAIIMGLDSASGSKGRLSMCIYSELRSSDLLDNIERWHSETAWFFNDKIKSFSARSIVECAFGVEYEGSIDYKNSKAKSDYVCKLIPCITEGRKVPKGIVRALTNKAASPQKYSDENYQTVLSIACAMIRKDKLENKEECYMALDQKCTDRSYLYGRLIAVADHAESKAYDKEETRTTNAKKYFEAFSNRPCTTWEIIHQKLSPYLEKLSKEGQTYYEHLINEVTNMFERDEFSNNSKLDPIYLHAYSCQIWELRNKRKSKADATDTDNEEE